MTKQLSLIRALNADDRKKIDMCRAFLVKRGYAVYQPLMATRDVAEYFGVSVTHIFNLSKTPGFPAPYDIGTCGKGDFARQRRASPRYSAEEIMKWMETRRLDQTEEES